MLAATINVVHEEPAADGRRADSQRVSIAQPSTVRNVEGAPHDVLVENLSARGIAFRSNQSFGVGMVVQVGLSGAGVARGRIVRHDGNLFGCVFDQPLNGSQLAKAFTPAEIVVGSFNLPGSARLQAAEFAPIRRWPGAARVGTLLGGAALSWWGLATLIRAALG